MPAQQRCTNIPRHELLIATVQEPVVKNANYITIKSQLLDFFTRKLPDKPMFFEVEIEIRYVFVHY
jgi:hypothetical protein